MTYDTFEEHVIQASGMPGGRKVWTPTATAANACRAVVFLDAEIYIERVKAAAVVSGLNNAEEIVAVFISDDSAAARHTDYTCNTQYSEFKVNDVLPWAAARYPRSSIDPAVVVGLSLSGLAAAFLAARFPRHFRAAVCQSPSFWWEKDKFVEFVPSVAGPELWISVGDKETTQGESHAPSGLS